MGEDKAADRSGNAKAPRDSASQTTEPRLEDLAISDQEAKASPAACGPLPRGLYRFPTPTQAEPAAANHHRGD
jgi:hypothetical protein